MTVELDPRPALDSYATASLDVWLAALTSLQEADRPIWKPSRGRDSRLRSMEHLTVLMASLHRSLDGFAIIEWLRPHPQPWAQTRPHPGGLLIELNDGVVLPGREHPITRRAFRGRPGDYPLPDESHPRYKTPDYPTPDIDKFSPLAGAQLIWTWITTQRLPPGIAVTMRHFGARERAHYGGGDL